MRIKSKSSIKQYKLKIIKLMTLKKEYKNNKNKYKILLIN